MLLKACFRIRGYAYYLNSGLLANFNKLDNSDVLPELDTIIKSFFSIVLHHRDTRWINKKLGIPTLEKVAAAFCI